MMLRWENVNSFIYKMSIGLHFQSLSITKYNGNYQDTWALLSLQFLSNIITLTDSLSTSASASRCADHACSPPMGNLASGRTLTTLSDFCGNGSHHHSTYPTPPAPNHHCSDNPHPPAHMVDDPFLHPDTWWASGADTARQKRDEIRLDLETRFCLTHLVLLFRSPRPAAMAVERSTDFGQTWETLKLFAHNCSLEFGFPDDVSQPGSLCTSRYASATPCVGGEVREYAQGLMYVTEFHSHIQYVV